ncbi:lysis protein [Amycolatopsis albispora]|uniref:Lysis protein n=1 Tax=Amycolatopsis albispora TaxID=1804986 RepID=A0A344LC39_9PSEU|nr:lysis protein [Amycolatopsis albispora]
MAGVAAAGALVLPGAAVAASPAPVAPAGVQAAEAQPAGVQPAGAKSLNIQYQVQETGYWCGPAAARIAMSARTGNLPSQGDLAAQMGTTENGTDHISQIANALNANLGTTWYEVKEMPNDPPTQAQKDLLWQDIVTDIDNGYAVVANIVAPPDNHPPGYPNETIYHYFTVIGYNSDNMTVHIADSANFGGNQIYWLSFDQLASLIPPKGYAA